MVLIRKGFFKSVGSPRVTAIQLSNKRVVNFKFNLSKKRINEIAKKSKSRRQFNKSIARNVRI